MTEKIEKIGDLCRQYSDSSLFTHASLSVGLISEPLPEYKYELLPDARNLYDLASLTKAVVTAPLIFWQGKKRGLSLGESVSSWLKSSGHNLDLPGIFLDCTIESLLTHRDGIVPWRNFYVNCEGESSLPQNPQRFIERLKRLRLQPTGDPNQYGDLGMIALGLILETITGDRIDRLFYLFCNSELGFNPEGRLSYAPSSKEQAISTGFCGIRQRELVGEVHDPNCWSLGAKTGHAGLFGTLEGLYMYLHFLFKSEVGRQFIDANATYRKVGNPSLLGWRQGNDFSSELFGGGLAMGHMGFTGTAFWLDYETYKLAIVLTNRVKNGPNRQIRQFRRDALQLLYSFT